MNATHDVTVNYTIDDDGIHLLCMCGADIRCGHSPTLTELMVKEWRHQQEVQS
jgi:hypothetical protein